MAGRVRVPVLIMGGGQLGTLAALARVVVCVESMRVLVRVELLHGLTVVVHHATETLKLTLIILLNLGFVVLRMLQLQVLV